MSAPFGGALGVVRVQVAPDVYLAALPTPVKDAKEYADALGDAVVKRGDVADLIAFDRGDGLPCWFRARDVITIDVVATEDPSC